MNSTKLPVDESPHPDRTTPARVAEQLDTIGQRLLKSLYALHSLGAQIDDQGAHGHAVTSLASIVRAVAEMAVAVRFGRCQIFDELIDRQAGVGRRPILDALEGRNGNGALHNSVHNPSAIASEPEAVCPADVVEFENLLKEEAVEAIVADLAGEPPTDVVYKSAYISRTDCQGPDPDTRETISDNTGPIGDKSEPISDISAAETAPAQPVDDWPTIGVEDLELGGAIVDALLAAGLKTAGDLKRHWDEERSFRGLPGFLFRDERVVLDALAGVSGNSIEGGGYCPYHPWYYKLAGRPVAAEKIIPYFHGGESDERGVNQYLGNLKDPAKKRLKLEAYIIVQETGLERDLGVYEDHSLSWRPPIATADQDAADFDDSKFSDDYDDLSISYSHVAHYRSELQVAQRMLAALPADEASAPVPANAAKTKKPRPDAKSKTAANRHAHALIHALHTDQVVHTSTDCSSLTGPFWVALVDDSPGFIVQAPGEAAALKYCKGQYPKSAIITVRLATDDDRKLGLMVFTPRDGREESTPFDGSIAAATPPPAPTEPEIAAAPPTADEQVRGEKHLAWVALYPPTGAPMYVVEAPDRSDAAKYLVFRAGYPEAKPEHVRPLLPADLERKWASIKPWPVFVSPASPASPSPKSIDRSPIAMRGGLELTLLSVRGGPEIPRAALRVLARNGIRTTGALEGLLEGCETDADKSDYLRAVPGMLDPHPSKILAALAAHHARQAGLRTELAREDGYRAANLETLAPNSDDADDEPAAGVTMGGIKLPARPAGPGGKYTFAVYQKRRPGTAADKHLGEVQADNLEQAYERAGERWPNVKRQRLICRVINNEASRPKPATSAKGV